MKLLQNYNPQEIEPAVTKLWDDAGAFNPDNSAADDSFSMVIPPPNITGSLHIGHALVNTIQDIIARSMRASGKKTLWLPGTDHAGIATQMMVTKEFEKRGISKADISRDQFNAEIWNWKGEQVKTIKNQLNKLGCSLDWTRERFTLDDAMAKSVRTAFIVFFKKGLIYKGERLVNWCPVDRTALSDLEVEFKDIKAKLYFINYKLKDGGEIKIATTRPETILGDVAIAVNPEDQRYKHLIGKTALVPIIGREIQIIADSATLMEFGTGALKITPAHDPIDFEIASRHNLPAINIFDDEAKINNIYPALEGIDRFVAREQIVGLLKQAGQLVDIKDHTMSVGHSQRRGAIVEPRLSKQWFFNVKELANQVLADLEAENFSLIPKFHDATLKHWLTDIKDWCISRQLWWGIKYQSITVLIAINIIAMKLKSWQAAIIANLLV